MLEMGDKEDGTNGTARKRLGVRVGAAAGDLVKDYE